MTQVLVDTSVWVDHFRNGHADLVSLPEADRVLSHPMILVEPALSASTLITPGASLWTLDKRLEVLASRFRVSWQAEGLRPSI